MFVRTQMQASCQENEVLSDRWPLTRTHDFFYFPRKHSTHTHSIWHPRVFKLTYIYTLTWELADQIHLNVRRHAEKSALPKSMHPHLSKNMNFAMNMATESICIYQL